MICPLCKTHNQDMAVYCKNCNYALLGDSFESPETLKDTETPILNKEKEQPSYENNQSDFFYSKNPDDIFKEVDAQLNPTNFKPYEKKPYLDKIQLKKSIFLASIIFIAIVSFISILTGINYYLCISNDTLNLHNDVKNITYLNLINEPNDDLLKIDFSYDMLDAFFESNSNTLIDSESQITLNHIAFQNDYQHTPFEIQMDNGHSFKGIGTVHLKTKNDQLILEISNYKLGNRFHMLPWTQKYLSPSTLEFPISMTHIKDTELKDFVNIFGCKLKNYEFKKDLLTLSFRINPSYGTVTINDYQAPNISTLQNFKTHWYFDNGENILRIPLSTISETFAGYSYHYDSENNRLYLRKPLLGFDVDYSMIMTITPTKESISFDFSNFKASNHIDVLTHQDFFITDTITKTYDELFEGEYNTIPDQIEFAYVTGNDYYLELHSFVDEQQMTEEFLSNIQIKNPYYVLKLLLLPDDYGNELAIYIDKLMDQSFNDDDLNHLLSLIQTNEEALSYLLGAFDKNGYDYFVKTYGHYFDKMPSYNTILSTQESFINAYPEINSDYSSFSLGNKFKDTHVYSNHTVNGYLATKGLALLTTTHSKVAFFDQNDDIVAIAYDDFSILNIHNGTPLNDTKTILDNYKIEYTQKFDFDNEILYITINIDNKHSVNFIFDDKNEVSYVIISKTKFVHYYI